MPRGTLRRQCSRDAWWHGSGSKLERTVGTAYPAEFQQTHTPGTRSLQLLVTAWADDEIELHTRLAPGTDLERGHLSEQGGFLQFLCRELCLSVPGTQQPVDQQAAQEKHCHHHRSQDPRNALVCTRTDIANRPDDQAEPEQHQKDHQAAEPDLHEGEEAVATARGRCARLYHCQPGRQDGCQSRHEKPPSLPFLLKLCLRCLSLPVTR